MVYILSFVVPFGMDLGKEFESAEMFFTRCCMSEIVGMLQE